MDWFKVYAKDLNDPVLGPSEDAAIGAWIRMLSRCYEAENGGCYKQCIQYSSRQWLSIAGVDKDGVDLAVRSGLAAWSDDSLFVYGYDVEQEKKATRRKDRGREMALARWGNATGNAHSNAASIATSNAEERRGEKNTHACRQALPTAMHTASPQHNAAGKPSAHHVLARFSAIRAEIAGGKALFWQASPKAAEKAAAWLQAMPEGAVADIEPAMRLACEKARDGKSGWTGEQMLDPNFLFGAFVARWSALREELHRKVPPKPGTVAARPPAKPAVPEWKPKGNYAAEAEADRAALTGLMSDLAEHVTPPEDQ